MTAPLLQVRNLAKTFGGTGGFFSRAQPLVSAIDNVSFDLHDGEVLGIVGESGCGKSTLAKLLLGLLRENDGSITLDGRQVSGLPPREARRLRSDVQYVHQDPGAALDPWWRVGNTLHETMRIHGISDAKERETRISEVLEAVGLSGDFVNRYPHELSGGQQRRIGLARTLALRPRIILLDEPTSGLDLSVQATVLRLMNDLRERYKLTYILISHDLSVVHRMCDRIAVMYLGRIVELGETEAVFGSPAHPYTKALIGSAPKLVRDDTSVELIQGDPPDATNIPSGCAFRSRCPLAIDSCAATKPELEEISASHRIACPPELRRLTNGPAASVSSL
ncbi:MAG: hypothetical protein VR78_01910 [Hoeflea sp. BRH_c9]|nr:MAG: hypothetical protein VR78_01910 [Hoeflea sp. BRH_c9]